MNRHLVLILTLVLIAPAVLSAAVDEPTTAKPNEFLNPASAGPSFAFQGEYSGVLTSENQNLGVQIIALGNDEYKLVAYPDGLPGDGFRPGQPTKSFSLKKEGEMIVANGDGVRIECNAKLLRWIGKDGKLLGTLIKVQRESLTLLQRPPADAVVLFDGKANQQFENAKLLGENYLLPDCTSRNSFGDHHLHLEFCIPFLPLARGQDRGNSGVYLQSRYEVQILDSFGLSGENNECGGIYTLAKPKVNMCYPPLSWQTYDIDFTAAKYSDAGKKVSNARVTIRHNGVIIHDDIELTKETPGKNTEANSPGPLYLQGHGSSVHFRNLWIQAKS